MFTKKVMLAAIIATVGAIGGVFLFQSFSHKQISSEKSLDQPLLSVETPAEEAAYEQETATKLSTTQSLVQNISSVQALEQSLKNKDPFIIKFSADWCGACNHMKAPFKQLAQEFKDKVTFYEVNVDQKDIVNKAMDLHVFKSNPGAVPTFIFLKPGEVHEEQIGGKSIEDMRALIKKLFNL